MADDLKLKAGQSRKVDPEEAIDNMVRRGRVDNAERPNDVNVRDKSKGSWPKADYGREYVIDAITSRDRIRKNNKDIEKDLWR